MFKAVSEFFQSWSDDIQRHGFVSALTGNAREVRPTRRRRLSFTPGQSFEGLAINDVAPEQSWGAADGLRQRVEPHL